MYIKSIHIESFGSLNNVDLDFVNGLNIIEGKNESGKSTIAMFIKFMLYGLSGRKGDDNMSEKKKYSSWNTGKAAGTMTIVTDREYRIERELFTFSDEDSSSDSSREKCSVFDVQRLEKVFKGKVPGEELLGMPEQIFINSSFVGQLTDGKINGEGMVDAIENLLLTGDEEVSTKKAIDKLEKVRTSLLHKNGSGGRISELTLEKNRLTERLNQAIVQSSDVIDLETSIVELDKNIEDREQKARYYGNVCDAYKKIVQKNQLEKVRDYANTINEIDDKLDEYSVYGNITDNVIEIQRLKSELNSIDERLEILRTRADEIEGKIPTLSDEDIETSRKDVTDAENLKKKQKQSIVFAVLSFILTALFIAVDFFVPYFVKNMPLSDIMFSTITLGIAGIFAILGVVSCINATMKKKKYNLIMEKWNAMSLGQLESNVENTIRLSKQRTNPNSDYSQIITSLEITQNDKLDVSTRLTSLNEIFTEHTDNLDDMTDNAINKANDISNDINELKSFRRELYGKYSVLSYILGEDGGESVDCAYEDAISTEEGKIALKFTPEDFEKCENQLHFAEGTLPQLRQQRAEKDSRLSALKATVPDPSKISTELECITNELDILKKQFNAIQLAVDTIQNAGNNLKNNLMPRISNEAGRIAGNFSFGKYTRLGVDNSFSMSFESEGRTREIGYLSAGTKDIAYLSVRTALVHVLFDNNVPPSVYDESFARIDENRLSKILDFLAIDGAPQSFVFTCRKLEGEIVSSFDNVKIIEIG